MAPLLILGGLALLGSVLRKRDRVGETSLYTRPDTEPLVYDFAREMAFAAQAYEKDRGWTREERAAIYLHTYWALGGRRRKEIRVIQFELGLPQTGLYDPATVAKVKDLVASAREDEALDTEE